MIMADDASGSEQIRFGVVGNTRMKIDTNSRISLSNNDSGGTGGQASTSGNTILGYLAGNAISSGDVNNTIIGHESAKLLNDGDNNVAIGTGAMDATTASSDNIAIGRSALGGGNVTNGKAIAIGGDALQALTSGAGNTAIGYQALDAETAGGRSTAVGYQALSAQNNATGSNTAVGWSAGDLIVGGYANTLLGSESGTTGTNDLTSGIQNTLIGQATAVSADSTPTNQTVIGRGAIGQANNSVTLGNASVTAVYMNQDSGATVHAGNVISNSNHAVEGYATGRNVIRSIRLNISPGDTPNTNISVDHDTTAGRSFNTPSLTDGTNIANNASSGSFALNDGSTRINIDVNNAIGMLADSVLVHDLNSSSTSAGEIYFTNTVISSNDLSVSIFKTGSDALVDWRTILDAGDSMTILITYMASS